MRIHSLHWAARAAIAGSSLLVAACGGGGGSDTPAGPGGGNTNSTAPTSITAVTTPAVSGPVAAALPTPLVVKVTDASSRAVAGVLVTFTITGGNGSVSPSSGTTDASGQVSATITLGTFSGSNQVTAAAAGVATKYTFTATGTALALAKVVLSPRGGRIYSIGDTLRLKASLEDQYGNTTTSSVSWASRDATLITVDATGLVRSLRRGASAYVVATAEGKLDSVSVEVPASPCVSGPAPTSLGVGQLLTGAAQTSVCITGVAGAEYAVVAFNSSPVAGASASFEFLGNGLGAAPAVLAASRGSSSARLPGATMPLRSPASLHAAARFESAFRAREQAELAPRVAAARSAMQRSGLTGAARSVLGAAPTVGDIVNMNISLMTGCFTPRVRGMRVSAISSRAIVVSDTANPTGGFTDSEYASIAASFDTLVVPVDEPTFGTATDIDNNSKVIIIYTRAINELSVPDGFIGGLFAGRDLFPSTGPGACSGSNSGEMFYMLVPDANGTASANKFTKADILSLTISTAAHEFQHLINKGRRLYVNAGAVADEELWLNEGMSHIAEELAYFRSAGKTARANLTAAAVLSSNAARQALIDFQGENIIRYEYYINAPAANSPYDAGDELETRGATWSFLRYAADRLGAADGNLWFRLANSTTAGMPNLMAVYGVDQAGLTAMFRDWATSVHTDDLAAGIDAKYTQPSWNWRAIFPSLFVDQASNQFPTPGSLLDGSPAAATLKGGGMIVKRFTIAAGAEALVRVTGTGGTALLAPVTLSVVRVK